MEKLQDSHCSSSVLVFEWASYKLAEQNFPDVANAVGQELEWHRDPGNNPVTDVVYRGNSGGNCTSVNIGYSSVHLFPIYVPSCTSIAYFVLFIVLFRSPFSHRIPGDRDYRDEDCLCVHSRREGESKSYSGGMLRMFFSDVKGVVFQLKCC